MTPPESFLALNKTAPFKSENVVIKRLSSDPSECVAVTVGSKSVPIVTAEPPEVVKLKPPTLEVIPLPTVSRSLASSGVGSSSSSVRAVPNEIPPVPFVFKKSPALPSVVGMVY